MKKCKIEVLKTTFHADLAKECCNYGLRPVIFKIVRTEEESRINYTPVNWTIS